SFLRRRGRHRDAGRALRAPAGGARAGEQLREGRHRAGHGRDAAHGQAAVRRAVGRRDRGDRRHDLLPGPRARRDRGGTDERQVVRMSMTKTRLDDTRQGDAAHGVLKARPLFDGPIVKRAIVDSIWKLDPRTLLKNPVIFTVEVVSVLVTIRIVADIVSGGPIAFDTAIAIGLWFTVLFANFAEAMA